MIHWATPPTNESHKNIKYTVIKEGRQQNQLKITHAINLLKAQQVGSKQ